MSSRSFRVTGRNLPPLSLRAAPPSFYTAAASQKNAIGRIARRHYSCHRLAFNPTSTLLAQQPLKPSSSKKAEQPSPTTTPISNGNTPSNSSKSPTIDIQDLTAGFADQTIVLDEGSRQVDWTRSFHGLSTEPFPKEVAEILTQPIPHEDVEVKPDGVIYLPEIKYRRILNRAFGPGGWGLAPRGETIITARSVTREYALIVLGRLVSVARGEQDYFSPENIPTAAEGCKSNAMVRCCKDLGVASELWDPRWVREYLDKNTKETFVEHVVTKKKKKITIRKDDKVRSPWRETKYTNGASA
ncbi:MAG: hypothetical protein M1839_007578 [Geoglossum umbratile]|nr:MAG: hypothetical protein M1839_007578 [Geoglossum umbratile]